MAYRLSATLVLASVLWALIFTWDRHADAKRGIPAGHQLLIEQCRVLNDRGLIDE